MSGDEFAGMTDGGSAYEQLNPDDGDGAALLEDVYAYLSRFVVYPSEHAHLAHALWIAHAHLMDCWDSTPRIAFLSPEPSSGKSRAIEVSETLVPNPVEAVNVTPAYLFRKVGADSPTVLYDEIDTVFGPKAKDNEEIRGLLNAGHRRGAVAGRCVVRGKVVETEEIPAYCAVALAGLGGLPDTLLARSVVVRMRKRAPHERIQPFRRRLDAPAGNALRDRLAAWADTVRDKVRDSWPTMPAGIEDRNADVWEALLSVADAAGGTWPKLARTAAAALVGEAKDSTPSLGVLLLADIRSVLDTAEVDRMDTQELLGNLCALDESPWGDLRGKRLDARGLARRLKQYDVRPHQFKLGDTKVRGYSIPGSDTGDGGLFDAFARYLPPLSPGSGTSGTDVPRADSERETGPSEVPDTPTGTGTEPLSGTQIHAQVPQVPDVPHSAAPDPGKPVCPGCGAPISPLAAAYGKTCGRCRPGSTPSDETDLRQEGTSR